MVHYKLSYFDIKALGEPIRFIFAVAGIPYEDDRVSYEKWPEVKHNFGYGQLPILYIDGEQLTQSFAIMRYLAKLHDLMPQDPMLAARCDEIVDTLAEVRLEFRELAYLVLRNKAEEEVKMNEVKKELREVQFPKYYKIFNEIVGKTNGKFITGNQLSWADLVLGTWLEVWETLITGPEFLRNYPNIFELREAVFEVPGIKAYVQQRPPTLL